MLTLVFLAARELNQLAGEVKYRLLPFVGHMADLGLNTAAQKFHTISPTIARRLLDGEYTPDKDYDENKFLSSSWESLTARLYPLLTEKIVRCLAGSDFTGKEVITAKEPVTEFAQRYQSTLRQEGVSPKVAARMVVRLRCLT
jgi:hypothetical protein